MLFAGMRWTSVFLLISLGFLHPQKSRAELEANLVWGPFVSNQLEETEPTAFWSIQINAPLLKTLGSAIRVRMDSPVFGTSEKPLSLLLHPGHTEYLLSVEALPKGWRGLGIEGHHVSGHRAAPLHQWKNNRFRESIGIGGASNFAFAVFENAGTQIRVGYGNMWKDSNSSPILLRMDGILYDSFSPRGPIVSVTHEKRVSKNIRVKGGLVQIWDHLDRYPSSGDVTAWGLQVDTFHPDRRVQFGTSYLGNNGAPNQNQMAYSVSVFVRLHWNQNKEDSNP